MAYPNISTLKVFESVYGVFVNGHGTGHFLVRNYLLFLPLAETLTLILNDQTNFLY